MSANTQNGAGIVRYVPGYNRRPDPKWYVGLDLGQRRDHTALAAIHLSWTALGQCPVTFAQRFQPELNIHFIERFPIGSSYDLLPGIVKRRLAEIEKHRSTPHKDLIIDAGGPGPAVVERLRRMARAELAVRPVLITGGKGVNTLTDGYTGIPRRTLVSTLLLAITANSIHCGPETPGWEHFESELLELSGETGHPASAAAHDDTVLAVALAVYYAALDTPQLLPDTTDDIRDANTCGFVNRPLF